MARARLVFACTQGPVGWHPPLPRRRHHATPADRHRCRTHTKIKTQDADGALCPHSQSTLIALLEKGVPFQARAAEAAPSEFRELFHAVLPAKGAKATPPLLVRVARAGGRRGEEVAMWCACVRGLGAVLDTGGNTEHTKPAQNPHKTHKTHKTHTKQLDGATHLAGAAVANAYLEEKYAGQGAPLMPPDAAARARVRLFADFFAATVLPPYRRVVHGAGALGGDLHWTGGSEVAAYAPPLSPSLLLLSASAPSLQTLTALSFLSPARLSKQRQ